MKKKTTKPKHKRIALRQGTVYTIEIVGKPEKGPRFPETFVPVKLTSDEPLVDLLRRAIEECGLTQSEIARGSGVFQPVIFRLTHGLDTSLKNAQKLIDFFGLEIVKRK